ncbi:MAG: IS200/IS605 family transposase [Candidatus Acidiferrales bacterium]
MSHTHAQNVIHVVFSTKDRRKSIPLDFQPRVWSYMSAICQKMGVLVLAVGGTDDHVHLLIQIPPPLALAKAVLTIKSNSSRWANKEGHKLAWQQGYGAFSVSSSNIPAVAQYIQNQRSHHKKMNFDAEFLALLRKHKLGFNPKFVFG